MSRPPYPGTGLAGLSRAIDGAFNIWAFLISLAIVVISTFYAHSNPLLGFLAGLWALVVFWACAAALGLVVMLIFKFFLFIGRL